MARSMTKIDVYLEVGQKRTFAGAIDWPGWCRGGRDEGAALRALFECGPRYARVVRATELGFQAPADVSGLVVVERLEGNAMTDFGAPGLAPASDAQAVDDTELRRLQTLLKACWRAFDAAVQAAEGKELRAGPRGGGRDTAKMVQHVLDGEGGYLSQLGWKFKAWEADAPDAKLQGIRQAILEGLAASARGEIPARGPRGGIRWTPRYYVRRAAWHVLDHAWEIEDRSRG